MTGMFIGVILVLIVAILVVRDQSEAKLRKLRSGLLAMRSHEQHLATEKSEVQQLISWVAESLKRAGDRQENAQRACRELREVLTDAGIRVESVPLEMPQREESGS